MIEQFAYHCGAYLDDQEVEIPSRAAFAHDSKSCYN